MLLTDGGGQSKKGISKLKKVEHQPPEESLASAIARASPTGSYRSRVAGFGARRRRGRKMNAFSIRV